MEIDANGTTTIGGETFATDKVITQANQNGFNMVEMVIPRGIHIYKEVKMMMKVEMVNALVIYNQLHNGVSNRWF